MFSLFLFAFIVCFLINYYNDGGTFIVFARLVEFVNSFQEKSPRNATVGHDLIKLDYKFGNRLYSIILPRSEPIKWLEAAAYVDGEWINRTMEVETYAGPWRNFYGLPVTPAHINLNYLKLGFRFANNIVIHVLPNEIIFEKLKTRDKLLQCVIPKQ